MDNDDIVLPWYETVDQDAEGDYNVIGRVYNN